MVLVVPEDDSDRYGDPSRPVTWDAVLTHPQPPALPDPAVDRAGLAALAALRTVIGDDADGPRAAFVAAALALARGSLASTAAGYRGVDRDGSDARAFLASEQSVLLHNAVAGTEVTGLALRDGRVALDFPFVRVRAGRSVAADASLDEAAGQLEALLRGPTGRHAFGAAGLRAPDGTRLPGPDDASALPRAGALPAAQVPLPVPPPRPVAVETLGLWTALTRQSRLLTVIDVSGSMAARAGDSDRITLAADAAQAGLALFPDSSSVGLWSFSSRPPPETSWQELVPLGPLTGSAADPSSRRAALDAQTATLPDRVGGRTALYDTVLAATRAVRAGYQAGSSNTVVLITDGRNEVRDGIDLSEVVATLRAEADPTRPVPVIAIGLGPEADAEALRQIAQATGGRSYLAQDPQDIRTVFLGALSQGVCRPGC